MISKKKDEIVTDDAYQRYKVFCDFFFFVLDFQRINKFLAQEKGIESIRFFFNIAARKLHPMLIGILSKKVYLCPSLVSAIINKLKVSS